MTSDIFVDASAWVAISNSRDKYHSLAKEFLQELVLNRRSLLTTNLVIAEAYIIIRKVSGLNTALRFLEVIHQTSFTRVIYSNAALDSQAEAILRQYSDQDFSLTDAVSFVVMRQFDIQHAFAFDHHFTIAGFMLIPQSG